MTITVLEDDKRVFPPYQACILLHERAETAHPRLRSILEELSGKINDAEMLRMNADVDVRGKTPADVTREFLARVGAAR
jgi:glycine betaine/choline ABC-type transport system substrate-binding protein